MSSRFNPAFGRIATGCLSWRTLFLAGILLVSARSPKIAALQLPAGTKAMRLVEGGRFLMGDHSGVGEADERPLRNIRLRRFYISPYEVTFSEFDKFCRATWRPLPEDNGWGRAMRPVINVSWYEALLFCNWLSEQHKLKPCYQISKLQRGPGNQNLLDPLGWEVKCDFSATGYRLPTEAEWEYAARGGGKSRGTPGSGSADPDSVAWYFRNARVNTKPVATLAPNELNIYDMSGNVAEWCWDWHAPQYDTTDVSTNPKGPRTGTLKVARGGSWEDYPYELRVAARRGLPPYQNDLRNVGFRVARSAGPR